MVIFTGICIITEAIEGMRRASGIESFSDVSGKIAQTRFLKNFNDRLHALNVRQEIESNASKKKSDSDPIWTAAEWNLTARWRIERRRGNLER